MLSLSALKMLLTCNRSYFQVDWFYRSSSQSWIEKTTRFSWSIQRLQKTACDGDVVGRLKRSPSGTMDAPLNWALTIRKVMMKLGYTEGKSNPCIYYHQKRGLRTVVHGDDVTTAGSFENIKWLHDALRRAWMVVERGSLGPPGLPNTTQDIRVFEQDYFMELWRCMVGTMILVMQI